MSDIKVVCTSDKNVSLTFTWDDFTPFHLVDIEGIYITTGTVQTAAITESGIGFYITEAGDYTLETNMESVMVTPKRLSIDYMDLMHTTTVSLREGTNMAYIGNYMGTYLLKESEV